MSTQGKYERTGEHTHYLDQLSTTFKKNNIVALPASTALECVQGMSVNIFDDNGNEHPVCLFDIPGEIFEAFYEETNDIPLNEQYVQMISTVKSILKSDNPQIHFFVVDKGIDERMISVGGGNIDAKLLYEEMFKFLRESKMLNKRAVGVYILLSKSDELLPDWENCSDGEKSIAIDQYIYDNIMSLNNSMERLKRDSGINDYKVIGTSVGEVFAKHLCRVNFSSMDLIYKIIINKVPKKRKGIFGKLLK